jgi:hypothetical protein
MMHFETLKPEARWRSALAPAAVGIMSLLATPLVAQKAQPAWAVEAFAARKDPLDSPLYGGIAITRYSRAFGLRLGGAAHFQGGGTQSVCDLYGCQNPVNFSLDAWTADADLIFEPLRVLPLMRKLLLGFSPYGFVGIGGRGVRADAAPDTSIGTFSYGAGVHHSLFGPLGLQAEARSRRPIQNDNGIPALLRENLAYSVGLRVGFGGKSKSKSPPPSQTQSKSAPSAPATRAPARRASSASAESTERFASSVLTWPSYLDKPYTYGGATPLWRLRCRRVRSKFARAGCVRPFWKQIATMGESISLKVGSLRGIGFFSSATFEGRSWRSSPA